MEVEYRKQIAPEKAETAFIDTPDELRINKALNLRPLECALEGYDHISDLLLANFFMGWEQVYKVFYFWSLVGAVWIFLLILRVNVFLPA